MASKNIAIADGDGYERFSHEFLRKPSCFTMPLQRIYGVLTFVVLGCVAMRNQ
jgi:hypothetical protein